MMIEPGITELSKCVDSRYTLVAMAAKRARMIGKEEHDEDYVAPVEKPVSIAAKEIAEGKVGYVRSERITSAKSDETAEDAVVDEITEAVFEEDIPDDDIVDDDSVSDAEETEEA